MTDDAQKPWQWSPGQRARANVRANESWSALGEVFIADICQSWKTHGKMVLARVADQKPEIYLRLVASLVPKEEEKSTSGAFDDVSDTELSALILAARSALNAAERDGQGSDDES
jgi:hypothetical protein